MQRYRSIFSLIMLDAKMQAALAIEEMFLVGTGSHSRAAFLGSIWVTYTMYNTQLSISGMVYM